jgi:hypothetical protein
LDCGGKRSATPLLNAQRFTFDPKVSGHKKAMSSLSARRCAATEDGRFATAVQDTLCDRKRSHRPEARSLFVPKGHLKTARSFNCGFAWD